MIPLPQRLVRPLAAGSRWTIPLIGLVLIASLVAVAWAQWQQLGLLGRAARFSDDNVVWSLFQLETEALHLGEALRQSIESPTPAQLEALSQRYEIFVSRVNLVEPARIRAVLATPDDHPRIHARLLAFVDDTREKQRSDLCGYPVLSRAALAEWPDAAVLAVP